MAKLKEREMALKLRKKLMSYSQIKKTIKVSKSSLSLWLRNYPLSIERIRELRGNNEARIEKFRQTMREKREKRLKEIYKEEKRFFLPLSKREKLIAGAFLYWGEGLKNIQSSISVTNTDPKIIKFTLYWFTKVFKIPRDRIKIYLHLYKDMNIEKEIQYWSSQLHISPNRFLKPYIKNSLAERINHKGAFGHGTCKISVNDIRLKERIIMSISAITDYYVKGV